MPSTTGQSHQVRTLSQALFGLRRFVVNEMIQSEKDYVKDLGVIVEVGLSLRGHLTPEGDLI